MKKIEELNKSKTPIAVYDKRLDKYENMPLFQKKVDKANEMLAKYPPTQILKEMEQKRIKSLLEQGRTIAEIAAFLKKSEEYITIRLQEMGLLEGEKV